MGAYRKLYFWKKFVECFLIHVVDISTSVDSNHYVMVGARRVACYQKFEVFSLIELSPVCFNMVDYFNIFTLGGFGCLTPFSSMWVSSSSWGGGLNKVDSLLGSLLALAYTLEMSNFMTSLALGILSWALLS